MQQIFKHRRDPRKAAVMKKAKELIEDLRPLRNTLTHGRYIGKSTKDEFMFILPAEFVISEEIPTANEMVVVERSDLVTHLKKLISIFGRTMQEFDHAKMQPIFALPGRVRSTLAASPTRGKDHKNANPSLDHLGRDFDFGSGRAGLSRVNG
jgi:hypothetical protein